MDEPLRQVDDWFQRAARDGAAAAGARVRAENERIREAFDQAAAAVERLLRQ